MDAVPVDAPCCLVVACRHVPRLIRARCQLGSEGPSAWIARGQLGLLLELELKLGPESGLVSARFQVKLEIDGEIDEMGMGMAMADKEGAVGACLVACELLPAGLLSRQPKTQDSTVPTSNQGKKNKSP